MGLDLVRLIQITDCHLGATNQDTLVGINTTESLRDVLALINRENPNFSALLCSGDISNDGSLDSYPRFIETVREIFSQPIGWIAGNHDDTLVMNGRYEGLAETRYLDLGEWQMVLLDSSVPNHVHGEVSAAELNYLQRTLEQQPAKPTIVALHHQLLPVGSEWIDKYIVTNASAVLDLLAQYAHVKIVTFGHVHQEFSANYRGIACFATPSTCIQFKPGCKDFTLDTLAPGYRWYDLYADGTFATGVSRVTDKVYPLDTSSTGY